jgi:hypothetical protein
MQRPIHATLPVESSPELYHAVLGSSTQEAEARIPDFTAVLPWRFLRPDPARSGAFTDGRPRFDDLNGDREPVRAPPGAFAS